MKLLKIFATSFFVLGILLLSKPVYAATPAKPVAQITLASVDIQDAKIVSQKDNTIVATFLFSNKEGAQSGVKYGVKLFTQDVKGHPGILVDEKVFDESLTLLPNSLTRKQITYIAPESLSGTFMIAITSSNDKGFPFGLTPLGVIKLTQVAKGVTILPGSCTVHLDGDPTKQLTAPSQNTSFNESRTAHLTCYVINNNKKEERTTPVFETHIKDMYGSVVSKTVGGDTQNIVFKPLEKKGVSVLLPKAQTPGTYTVSFGLIGSTGISNTIQTLYTVRGASASILNFSLDKDYYKSGAIAQGTLVWVSQDVSKLFSTVRITDSHGASCGNVQKVQLNQIKTEIPFTMNNDCFSPHIQIVLQDEKGLVLDQKVFDVVTKSATYHKISSFSMTYILAALLVILGLGLYIKRRKDGMFLGTKILTFFIIPLALFAYAPSAHAGTFAMGLDNFGGANIGTGNIDKSNYAPGEAISVTGAVTSSLNPNYLSLTAATNGSAAVSLFGTTPVYGAFACWMDPTAPMGFTCGTPLLGYTTVPYGSTTIAAPATAGNYTMDFIGGVQQIPVASGGCGFRPYIGGTVDDTVSCVANINFATDVYVDVTFNYFLNDGNSGSLVVTIPPGVNFGETQGVQYTVPIPLMTRSCIINTVNADIQTGTGC